MKKTTFINKDKRAVVVVIDDCERDVIRKIVKIFKSEYSEDFLFFGHRSFLKSRYVGKAKCHPDDEFNIRTGEMIAGARALEKYNRDYDKEVNFVIDLMDDLTFRLESIFKNQ